MLLSHDPGTESYLRESFGVDGDRFRLRRADDLIELAETRLETVCHAVLLDMRMDRKAVLEAIHFIGDLRGEVALVCLCAHHKQLREYKDVTHLVDDYLLADRIEPGELPTRVGHAIRRRKKEHALAVEQQLLQSLLDNIPDAIFFKDTESRFIKANANMFRKYGTGLPDIIGKTDFDLFTVEHARPAFEDEQEIIRTGKPMIGKVEKETFADGRVNWVNTTKLPLRDENDRIIGTMGISRDISDLKLAEEALNRERMLLMTIIDHAPAGIFVKNLKGRYLLVNEEHVAFLGAEGKEEVIGKTLFDIYTSEEAARITALDKRVMESGDRIHKYTERRTDKDGKDLWIMASKVPFRDDQGEVMGIVGIWQNVTDQKKTEERLRAAVNNLEETRLQLIEAEKMKTVGRMAAGVAHEVKNPLAVVRLGVEYLQNRGGLAESETEILADMSAAVDKANEVIFELLDFSTPHEATMKPMDINELIRRALQMARHSFRKADVEIVEELAGKLPPVAADESKLDQVFMNLLLNAVEAMPDGGTITVRSFVRRMTRTGGNVSGRLTQLFRVGDPMVVVEVEDSGHGIEAGDLDKLFDPFFSTRTTGEGTGLGLSVTRNIVEMHRGSITLENRRVGRGAVARIVFPTYDKHEKAETTQAAPGAGRG